MFRLRRQIFQESFFILPCFNLTFLLLISELFIKQIESGKGFRKTNPLLFSMTQCSSRISEPLITENQNKQKFKDNN